MSFPVTNQTELMAFLPSKQQDTIDSRHSSTMRHRNLIRHLSRAERNDSWRRQVKAVTSSLDVKRQKRFVVVALFLHFIVVNFYFVPFPMT